MVDWHIASECSDSWCKAHWCPLSYPASTSWLLFSVRSWPYLWHPLAVLHQFSNHRQHRHRWYSLWLCFRPRSRSSRKVRACLGRGGSQPNHLRPCPPGSLSRILCFLVCASCSWNPKMNIELNHYWLSNAACQMRSRLIRKMRQWFLNESCIVVLQVVNMRLMLKITFLVDPLMIWLN